MTHCVLILDETRSETKIWKKKANLSGRYIWTDGTTDDGSPSQLGGQQFAKCFVRLPVPMVSTKRRRVRIDESYQYLRHNPAPNRT